ncbi:MAG: chloride channel protein, partial [Pseudomonadota bacterium]
MHHEPDFFENLRTELSSWRLWLDRAIVLGYAIAAGLFVVGFTMAAEWAFGWFERLHHAQPWAVLIWTPALTAGIVWATRRWFPGAGGSGIPQIKAALDPAVPPESRGLFASLRLTVAKIALGTAGFAAGLSIGREGPSVQVAAGVMQHARRWLSPGSTIDPRSLLVAGGAAGIAAAFNAPLAGVVFAIEELSGRLEARASGLIIAAIVLAGLVAVSAFGNLSYFGIIRVPPLGWHALGPGLLVALVSGVAGGLFARLMIASLTGAPQRLNHWRARWPVRFAAVGGLLV